MLHAAQTVWQDSPCCWESDLVTAADSVSWLGEPSILENTELALVAMVGMLALVCVLTALDRIARAHKGIAGTAIGAWCTFAPIGLLRASIVGDPLVESAWAAAAIYLIVIVATLGRPLLIASVRGHEKVPTGGQEEVLAGGQVEVPIPRSSCWPGA